MNDFRVESDFLGTKKVPKAAYYGISAVRSHEIFQVSDRKFPLEVVYAIAQIKQAAAQANFELGMLDGTKKNAIQKACGEIISGKFDGEFFLDVFQVGSGTPVHMTVNEVVAHRANELMTGSKEKNAVDKHDDVNMGQSTNDVVPAAIRVAAMQMLGGLDESLVLLEKELKKKSKEFSGVLKSGRTHLQDAVPITLGQEFGAYVRAVEKHRKRLQETKNFLKELGVGGTAVGTGLNTFPNFGGKVVLHLNKQSRQKFVLSKNKIESTQFLTDAAAVSSALKLLAVDLNKVALDLRLMNSGPHTGLNEIDLPVIEPGSSIMPGKINPSVAECVNMCALSVIGNDVAIGMACANGVFELNTHMPLIASNLIESLKIMKNSARIFAVYAIRGVKAHREKCEYNVLHSAALGTALNPLIGYEKVAKLVKESRLRGVSVKELAVKEGYISAAEAKKYLNPKNLTSPNLHLLRKGKKK